MRITKCRYFIVVVLLTVGATGWSQTEGYSVNYFGKNNVIVVPTKSNLSADRVNFADRSALRRVYQDPPVTTRLDIERPVGSNYKNGVSILLESPDGTEHNFKFISESGYQGGYFRIYYMIDPGDEILEQLAALGPEDEPPEGIGTIDLSTGAAISLLGVGRIDIVDDAFENLQPGSHIVIEGRWESPASDGALTERIFFGVQQFEESLIAVSFPTLAFTDLTVLEHTGETTLFAAIPLFTVGLGVQWNRDEFSGVGVGGVGSADVPQLLGQIGEAVNTKNFRLFGQSIIFGFLFDIRVRDVNYYVGIGWKPWGEPLPANDNKSLHWGITMGTDVLELLNRAIDKGLENRRQGG